MSAAREVYALVAAALPERDCTRRTRCCQLQDTGNEPVVTMAELDLVLAELKRQGRGIPPPRPDGACPLLARDGAGCLVYEARPLGCRTHFCREAGGAVPARAVREAVQRLNQVEESERPSRRGARPLRAALESRRKGRLSVSW